MNKIKKAFLSVAFTVLLSVMFLFLFACSNATVYTYTFESNGGTAYEQIQVEEGQEYELPKNPERPGFSFEGWYATSDFSGAPIKETVATQDATYYAKWAQLFEVELKLNGGSLSTTSVYLKQGEKIYDAVQSYVPTNGDLTFGDWFYNGRELSKQSTLKMPAEKIILEAKYKAEYTVTLMVQDLKDEELYLESDHNIKGLAYVGETLNFDDLDLDVDLSVYNAVGSHDGNVSSLTVNADKTQNELIRYFDRKVFMVSFNPNYPNGAQGTPREVYMKYGEGMNVPVDYTAEGYVLAGWARSSNATTAEYDANYIATALYNKPEGTEEYVSFWLEPKATMPLYAVWIQGMADLFGESKDYIYHLNDTDDFVYLGRGDKFFIGDYYKDDNTFTFRWEGLDGPELLEGKLLGNNAFAYTSETRGNWTGYLFENQEVVRTTTLGLDQYNGFTLTENGKVSYGTYIINPDSSYLATFTDGDRKGQEMTWLMGSSGGENVFRIRNEEEFKIGNLVRYYVTADNRLSYYDSDYSLTLTGFGIAYYNASGSAQGYNYTKDGDVVSLIYNGDVIAKAYIMDDLKINGYMIYDAKYDQDFTLESGATLSIDGLGRAKYVNGSTVVEGYYTTENSLLADSILTFTNSGKTYKFLITATTVEMDDTSEGAEEGAKVEVTTYGAIEKLAGYQEFYYMDAESIWYAPLLVLDDIAENKATVYGRTKEGKFVPMFYGDYAKITDSNLYTFTWTADAEGGENVFTDPFDLTTIQAFTFALDSSMTQYNIHYWYSSTQENGQPVEYDVLYNQTDGNATLTLIASIAIYDLNGTVDVGLYSMVKDSNLMKISAPTGTIYVELDEDNKTFIRLEHAPYDAFLLNLDGTASETEYLSFDGKGGATYNVITKNGDEKVVTPTAGTLAKTEEKTELGYDVYTFTMTDRTLKFIRLSSSSAVYVSVFNDKYSGEYTASGSVTLKLDGYNTYAKYVDDDSKVYEGMYIVSEENVVQLLLDNGSFYFDLASGRTFTVRGSEYGTYLYYDNQDWNGVYLEFNGYIVNGKGQLTAFVMKETIGGEAEKFLIGEGWYAINGNSISIYYEDKENGNHPIAKTGVRGYVAMGNSYYPTFIVDRENVEKLYINEYDWSILSLDSIGNAVLYNSKGVREYGRYTLVTDTVLYYANNAGTDACLYYYDVENGTIEPITYKRRGYYTEKLDSLLFAEYGVALFNGTDRYFYMIEEDSSVTLYRQDARDPNANEYGIVKDTTFGKLTETVNYNGAKYYQNLGWDILFSRDTIGEKKYPVNIKLANGETEAFPLCNLTFLPTGDAQSFIVNAAVEINGQTYSQKTNGVPTYVVREVDEDGNARMYVMLGNFQFDIEVSYKGVNEDGESLSTYKVTGMRYVVSTQSYGYLQTLYMYYFIDSLLGTSYASSLTPDAVINIVTEYNEDGSKDENPLEYIDAEFGELWGIVDSNGKEFTFKGMAYTYDSLTETYTITVTSDDSYTYHLHFAIENYDVLGTYGFILLGFTREQTLPSVSIGADAYDFTLERVISSDMGMAGTLYSFTLKKNGIVVPVSEYFTIDGKLHCVVRTDESTTYYVITLEELSDGIVDGEETKKKVLPYSSFNVTEEVVETKYTEDGTSFVDIASWGVTLISYEEKLYAVSKCTATADGYLVETSAGVKFEITLVEDNIVLELVED